MTIILLILLGLTLMLLGGKIATIKNAEYPRIPRAIKKSDDILAVVTLLIMSGVIVFLIV
jgi:hypothetical protein